jgi:two-component system, OmpR family, phosphate regulon sensor histidine kinase PhoR
MKNGKRPRPLLLFYILVFYVLLQFGWWAFLLIKLNNENSELRKELQEQEFLGKTAVVKQTEEEHNRRLHKQWMMILGEGTVFLLLLSWGIIRTRNSFKQEAELSNRQKNFILSVTHELRSPLTSIRLQLETVLKRDLPREKQQEMHLSAMEDIDRLNALIENILTAARIDNHSYVIHPERGSFSTCVNDLIAKIRPLIKQHTIKAEISSGIEIEFDKNGFHSIFLNLVENAVKYSPASSEIKISLEKKNQALLFAIRDSGSGIPDAEKEKIFERFYRIGNEETRSAKGTGLGLYIVRSLVEAHGWQIELHSQVGSGTTFLITIPLIKT